MHPAVTAAHFLVARLEPVDEVEAAHRSGTLDWLESTDDVFRRVKPAVPPRHLVSYVVPFDPTDGSILLVAHRSAGLWLPPGGHVEPGEDCHAAAGRELAEELGLAGDRVAPHPVFLTVTRTVGAGAGHTDVSLWFTATVDRDTPLTPDTAEFGETRWWSRADLAGADPALFDPHLSRFVRKQDQV